MHASPEKYGMTWVMARLFGVGQEWKWGLEGGWVRAGSCVRIGGGLGRDWVLLLYCYGFCFFCFIIDRRLLLLKESRDGPMGWLGCAGIFC